MPVWPERVDVLARVRNERDMQAVCQRPVLACLCHAEVVPLVEMVARVRDRVAERREDGLVEAAAGITV